MDELARQTVTVGKYSVTVATSTVIIGMLRYKYGTQAREAGWGGDDPYIQTLAQAIYPNLVSAVVEHSGFDHWPPTFEEFCALPEKLWNAWTDANRKVNPDWYDEEKKEDPDPKG